MIAVVDSGSTKCDWIVLDDNGQIVGEKMRTKGLNPAILSAEVLKQRIKENSELVAFTTNLRAVYFYGAGCGTPKARKNLRGVLEVLFANAKVIIKEDTWAGVYSTINSPNEAAVVCIMGTGSNCSYFDGENLHQRVDSLGYTIMDDAAGNYFGKQLIRSYYYNQMPEAVARDFEDNFDLNADVIKYNLYKLPNPNAYLANFASFMFRHQDTTFMQDLIKDGIREFSKNMILQFKEELPNCLVHFAGSIAYFSKKEIQEVALEFGYKTGNFVRRPIEGLVAYHQRMLVRV